MLTSPWFCLHHNIFQLICFLDDELSTVLDSEFQQILHIDTQHNKITYERFLHIKVLPMSVVSYVVTSACNAKYNLFTIRYNI